MDKLLEPCIYKFFVHVDGVDGGVFGCVDSPRTKWRAFGGVGGRASTGNARVTPGLRGGGGNSSSFSL